MTEYTKVNFTNENDFDILLLKYTDINSINWNDLDYLDKLINLDTYQIINTNSNKFLDDISEHLEVNKYNEFCNLQIYTQVVAEFSNYIYELLYFVCFDKNNKIIQKKELLNGIGSLLNTNEDQIFNNAILIKTYLPTLSKEMKIHNIIKNDIKEILYNRINTKYM